MGVFGAVFGRSGDVGFSGPLLGASSGVGGFNVAMLLRLVCEKVRPAWSGGGCEREIVRPARSKHPKIGIFTLAGRVFSRKCGWRGGVGRVFSRKSRWRGRAGRGFSRQSALCPGLVGDVAHFRLAAVGDFAALEAGWRRVVGVSEPHVVQIPPIGGGEAAT